jgi:hypothetical protein
MSVATELQSLQELRGKGTLTDAEFTAAKASVLGGQPQAHPIAKARPMVRPGFIVALVVFLGLIGYLWFTHLPVQFSDQVDSLPAHSYKTILFTLPYDGNFSVDVSVLHGNPIDVFVVGSDQLGAVQAEKWNEVHPYAAFVAMKTQAYERTGHLPKGMYYLVLRDLTLGVLSASTSDISVKARLAP